MVNAAFLSLANALGAPFINLDYDCMHSDYSGF